MGIKNLQVILELIKDEKLGQDAAKSVSIIMQNSPSGILTPSAFAIIRKRFYKQRLFNICLPQILEITTKPNIAACVNSNYWMTLSYLVQCVPQSLILQNAGKLLPMMLQSLSSHNSVLRKTTLDALSLLLSSSSSEITFVIAEHLNFFINQLFECSNLNQESNYKVSWRQFMFHLNIGSSSSGRTDRKIDVIRLSNASSLQT